MCSASLNDDIQRFGAEIFKGIAQETPSTLNKNFWISKVMEWSMRKPDFKLNLFRLVDVLPSLHSKRAIASHIAEYLTGPAREINFLLGWAANLNPRSLRGLAGAFAMERGVHEIASLFIAGDTPSRALKKIQKLRRDRLCFTIDLLGEFCVSEREAEAYLARYLEALTVLSQALPQWPESAPLIEGHPGDRTALCISVKLTALYSQCSPLNFDRSVQVLSGRLSAIVKKAVEINASLYVDAEDSNNNPIIYETFKRVFGGEFKSFPYPGIVLQGYARDSQKILDDLLAFARTRGTPIALRLVKGAYWDYESVMCAQQGYPSPLFANKESTDAHFELLTRHLIDNHEICLPAIASHNIRSLSHACLYAERKGLSQKNFELQMLYGMAEPIAKTFSKKGYLVRLYVPLGDMFVGMGYLVRRLLENTSNESFLRHTFFDEKEISYLLREPQMISPDVAE